MKKFSLFVFLVFFVMGCGVSRKAASHSVQKDSLIYKEIVRVDTLRVPQDRVQVVVDNTILNLKEKEIQDLNYQFLQYKQTTGSRANINFKILKDSVYIEGTCDSMELLSLRKEVEQYQSSKFEKSEKQTKGMNIWDMILLVLGAFVIGCIVGLLIKTLILR